MPYRLQLPTLAELRGGAGGRQHSERGPLPTVICGSLPRGSWPSSYDDTTPTSPAERSAAAAEPWAN